MTHVAEIHNVEADPLSRLEINAKQVSDFGINCEQFAIDKHTDATTLQRKNNPGESQIKESQQENSTNAMLGNVSTGNFRPIVVTAFRGLIFKKFHSLS